MVLQEILQNSLSYQTSCVRTCTPLSTISQAAVEEFGAIDFITVTIALFVLFCKISHRYSTDSVTAWDDENEYYGTPCCQMTNSIYHLVSPRGSVGSNIYRSGCSADIDIDNRGLRVCWIEFMLFISMYIRKNQAHRVVKIMEITVTSWMKCILRELRGSRVVVDSDPDVDPGKVFEVQSLRLALLDE